MTPLDPARQGFIDRIAAPAVPASWYARGEWQDGLAVDVTADRAHTFPAPEHKTLRNVLCAADHDLPLGLA